MSRIAAGPRFRKPLRSRGNSRPLASTSGTEGAASVPRPVPLRHNNDFRMLWTGQLLTLAGALLFGAAAMLVPSPLVAAP